MKKYRLLITFAGLAVGTVFIDAGCCYIPEQACSVETSSYKLSHSVLERNPEWFEPIDERWKPKYKEAYWYVNGYGRADREIWYQFEHNKGHYRNHNCFQTKEQAVEAAKRIKQALLYYYKELKELAE